MGIIRPRDLLATSAAAETSRLDGTLEEMTSGTSRTCLDFLGVSPGKTWRPPYGCAYTVAAYMKELHIDESHRNHLGS